MGKVFRFWARVVDGFIPAKRSKGGQRFGFVRVVGEIDTMATERKLDSIWI